MPHMLQLLQDTDNHRFKRLNSKISLLLLFISLINNPLYVIFKFILFQIQITSLALLQHQREAHK